MDMPGRVRASSYLPQIWAAYDGYRPVQTYRDDLTIPVGSYFYDQSLIEQSAYTYIERLRSLAIDALLTCACAWDVRQPVRS